jgi:hypothetical protein
MALWRCGVRVPGGPPGLLPDHSDDVLKPLRKDIAPWNVRPTLIRLVEQ